MYPKQRASYDRRENASRSRRAREEQRPGPLFLLLLGLVLGWGLGWGLRGFALSPQRLAAPAPSQGVQTAPPSGPAVPASLKDPPACPDWIEQDFLTINECSRPGATLDAVNGVVIHYVGNPGTTAKQNHSYFQNLAVTHETYASSHFLIGLEGEIIQNIPLDEVAYCSSQRNDDTISIECCHPGEDGAFTKETYDSLIKLVRWLMDYYELDTSQVIRHYDITGKECPLYYVRDPDAWEDLLADLERP